MRDLRNRKGAVSPWIPFALLLVIFALFFFFMFLPTQKRANHIHEFLGNNTPGNESGWSGFMKSWEDNNAFHREQYTKIACELEKLNGNTTPPCPDGGQTGRPPGGPTYP